MTLWDLKNQISIGTLGSDKYLGLEDSLEYLGLAWVVGNWGLTRVFRTLGLTWVFGTWAFTYVFRTWGLTWVFGTLGLTWVFGTLGLTWVFGTCGLTWVFGTCGLTWVFGAGRSRRPLGSTELKNWHRDWNTSITDGALDKLCKGRMQAIMSMNIQSYHTELKSASFLHAKGSWFALLLKNLNLLICITCKMQILFSQSIDFCHRKNNLKVNLCLYRILVYVF